LVPDAFISSSSDSGRPAEYKAASILAAISASGSERSRNLYVSLYLSVIRRIDLFILLLFTVIIVIIFIVAAVTLSLVQAGRVSS
jgi:hypothetical protein